MTESPSPQAVFDSFRLDGKVAIVTGASAGLGDRFARVLHAAGSHVVAAARRADLLDALAAEFDRIVPVRCDVTVDSDLEHLVEVAMGVTGKIDILVNNAGVVIKRWADRETPDEFGHVVDVNLIAVHRLAQLCGRVMIEKGGGVICNVASMFGLVGAGDVAIGASYSATKGAVVNLTRELAAQWGKSGVRVNALAPGYFSSEMTADFIDNDEFAARMKRKAPLARAGLPHELDGALLFLVSDASSYVTGTTLLVDGGWTAV